MSIDYDINLDRTDVSDDIEVRMLAVSESLEKIQVLLKDINNRLKHMGVSHTFENVNEDIKRAVNSIRVEDPNDPSSDLVFRIVNEDDTVTEKTVATS
tara:strand:+ start:342 stop:635 length:294 start_codon:yes stop_codon:yes gene_type:complete